MPSVLVPILAPWAASIAVLLPAIGQGSVEDALEDRGAGPDVVTEARLGQDFEAPVEGPQSTTALPVRNPLDALYTGQTARQMRVEQRVVVRIRPRRSAAPQPLSAQRPLARRYEEREMDRCVAIDRISAVQTDTGNRLLLFMRDERVVSVNLERACRARDFYSGFYIEQSADQQMCAGRDELHSRSGARCEIDRMRLLVPVRD